MGRIQRLSMAQKGSYSSVKICYYVSRMVITKNLKDHKQAFYEAHQSRVTAIAVHPSRTIVASTSCSKRARIDIWDVQSFNTLCSIETGHSLAVNCLKFSHDGVFVGSVGVDENFSLQISDWVTGQVIAFRNTSKRPIIDFEFNPIDKYEFSTGAYNCVSTWHVENGAIILKRVTTVNTLDKGNFPFVTCLVYLSFQTSFKVETNILTANNFGDLGVIANDRYNCTKKTAHKKMINSLVIADCFHKLIVTGGEDEFIKVWSTSFDLLVDFNLRTSNIVELSSSSDVIFLDYEASLAIQSLDKLPIDNCDEDIDEDCITVLAGTRNGDILKLEIDLQGSKPSIEATVLSKNHSTQDVSESTFDNRYLRMALHPQLSIMASVGRERSLCIWNIKEKTIMERYFLGNSSLPTTLRYNPDGTMLCIGFQDGTTKLYQSKITEIEYKRETTGIFL